MKPFYIHITKGTGKMPSKLPRGATIKVCDADNPRMVEVRISLCSPKDQFCKATGRAVADNSKAVAFINKRDLSKFIERFHWKTILGDDQDDDLFDGYSYLYIYKYMV